MKTIIIDYGSGNLRSAEKSTVRAAEGLDMEILVSASPNDVKKADRIILPGVGAFADCMNSLTSLDGMIEALQEAVLINAKPILGICVGMQLMGKIGLEHGQTEGLGWINGIVEEIDITNDPSLKIPHVGWNNLHIDKSGHPMLQGINSGDHAYFVHGYHFKAADLENVLAHVNYGTKIAAIIGRDNIAGTQFHPEKSQKIGLRIIKNFLQWSP